MSTAKERWRWRMYNHSEVGKVRYRRYRQSEHGKAKLREKYQERVGFLDDLKVRAGCLVCGEKDPRVLSFIPRPGQKVKFRPQAQNISRSLEDWEKVIVVCDVLCRNCLARKKRGGESMKAKEFPKTYYLSGPNQIVNDLSQPGTSQQTICRACGAELRPKNERKTGRRREFCDSHCRLIHWARTHGGGA